MFERDKYVLKIAFIHGRKGESATGADLAFELSGNKIVLIQSKRVGTNGRIVFDRLHLKKLLDLERQLYRSPKVANHCLPQVAGPMCRAAYYQLVMRHEEQTEKRFFQASEISFTLGCIKSASQGDFLGQGLAEKDFEEMFHKCEIGGPDMEESKKRKMLYDYSLVANRVFCLLHIELRK